MNRLEDLGKIRTLDQGMLMKRLGNWLGKEEIEALHARAMQIVDIFDRAVAAKGEGAVLFDLDRGGTPCTP